MHTVSRQCTTKDVLLGYSSKKQCILEPESYVQRAQRPWPPVIPLPPYPSPPYCHRIPIATAAFFVASSSSPRGRCVMDDTSSRSQSSPLSSLSCRCVVIVFTHSRRHRMGLEAASLRHGHDCRHIVALLLSSAVAVMRGCRRWRSPLS
jgi:hypothetical protein